MYTKFTHKIPKQKDQMLQSIVFYLTLLGNKILLKATLMLIFTFQKTTIQFQISE